MITWRRMEVIHWCGERHSQQSRVENISAHLILLHTKKKYNGLLLTRCVIVTFHETNYKKLSFIYFYFYRNTTQIQILPQLQYNAHKNGDLKLFSNFLNCLKKERNAHAYNPEISLNTSKVHLVCFNGSIFGSDQSGTPGLSMAPTSLWQHASTSHEELKKAL